MNRRIRNRTYGGVGGRGAQAPLLPDFFAKRGISDGFVGSPSAVLRLVCPADIDQWHLRASRVSPASRKNQAIPQTGRLSMHLLCQADLSCRSLVEGGSFSEG